MKNITYSLATVAILLGVLTGCTNSTTSIQKQAPLDVAKEKTTKFAKELLAGKDTTASQFTKDVSYNSSKTPIIVTNKGNIVEGGMLKYFDEDNHQVTLVATDENELTASIDFNDDGLISDDEIFIAIKPSDIGEFIDADEAEDQMMFEDYIPLSKWLSNHSAMDTVDVYIVLPVKLITPVVGNEISIQMVQIDTEATKKQILDFIDENGLVRIEDSSGFGMDSMFKTNLTKEKIESLLAKYDENEFWIELETSVTMVE